MVDEERALAIVYENTQTNPEYNNKMKEVIGLSTDIIDKLGPYYHLFLKYEQLICETQGMHLIEAIRLNYR